MAIEDGTDTQARTRETDDRPVEPVDYAVLNAVYGALLTAMVVATRDRARTDPITTRELIPLGAATFALAKVVAREKIGSWMRDPFVEIENGEQSVRGRRLMHALHRRLERTCRRGRADGGPAGRPHRDDRARGLGCERLAPGELQAAHGSDQRGRVRLVAAEPGRCSVPAHRC